MDALLIVLFGLLQCADGIVTYLGLRGAGLEEANPVANLCFEILGEGSSITLLKLLALSFVIFLFLERRKMKSRWITGTLASGVLFSSWAFLHNITLVLGY